MNTEHTAELSRLEAELGTLSKALSRARGQYQIAKEEEQEGDFWTEEDEEELHARFTARNRAAAALESWNREHAERLGELRTMRVIEDPVGKGERS